MPLWCFYSTGHHRQSTVRLKRMHLAFPRSCSFRHLRLLYVGSKSDGVVGATAHVDVALLGPLGARPNSSVVSGTNEQSPTLIDHRKHLGEICAPPTKASGRSVRSCSEAWVIQKHLVLANSVVLLMKCTKDELGRAALVRLRGLSLLRGWREVPRLCTSGAPRLGKLALHAFHVDSEIHAPGQFGLLRRWQSQPKTFHPWLGPSKSR